MQLLQHCSAEFLVRAVLSAIGLDAGILKVLVQLKIYRGISQQSVEDNVFAEQVPSRCESCYQKEDCNSSNISASIQFQPHA